MRSLDRYQNWIEYLVVLRMDALVNARSVQGGIQMALVERGSPLLRRASSITQYCAYFK